MNPCARLITALACLTALASADLAHTPAPAHTAQPPAATPAIPDTNRLPGVDLAEGISQITGTAISPLLGVSTVGAWKYFQTPAENRHRLPWFCHPYAWGFGFSILSLCLLKDLLGPGTPALIKKPLDMAETFEDKISAAVATVGFVPYIASRMADTLSSIEPTSSLAGPGLHLASAMPLAFLDGGPSLLLVPLSMIAFVVVWLTSHGINILISLCPFVWLDGFLKLGKLILLSLIPIAYAIAPWLGAAICVAIIIAASFLAAPSFRLTLFGTTIAGDILFPWLRRDAARPANPRAFIAHASTGLPKRTCGRLHLADSGELVFTYRPWLILPRASVTLRGERHSLVKGLLFPSLLHTPEDGEPTRILILPPRYRNRVEEIARHHAISDIRENPVLRGFKAAKSWLAEIFQSSRKIVAR